MQEGALLGGIEPPHGHGLGIVRYDVVVAAWRKSLFPFLPKALGFKLALPIIPHKNLIAAFATQHCFHLPCGQLADHKCGKGRDVGNGFVIDPGQSVEQVVAGLRETSEQVVAVSFMVAEGILRDRMVERCRALGVDMVPGALARTSALADLVIARTL